MQNFGQPNPYMGQQFGQYDPNMAQFAPGMGQFDPNMGQFMPGMGQFDPNMAQFDPNMVQFDPNMVMPDQTGQGMGYGHQWAQYEDQAAQYSPTNTVEGENAEIEVGQDGEQTGSGGMGEGDMAEGEETDPYAVDENDPNAMGMPLYGAYDQTYISEFGANENAAQYGYNPYGDMYGYAQSPYIDGNQPVVEQRWRAHPVLVFSLMLICFPVGLALMLFFTDWGAFAKIYTTIFVLAMALAVYEILVNKNVIAAPSIIQTVKDMLG